jgi:uncharacterized protein YndB with AHSA1/START domain
MNRKGTLSTVDGRNQLRFERLLRHPIEKVWRAITESTHLVAWFPARIDGDFVTGGKLHFVFEHSEGLTMDGEVRECDPPRLLAYTWDTDLLRFELSPDPAGCLLIFTHSFGDRPVFAASYASGWEACLAALESVALDEQPAESLPQTWTERHEQYIKSFGLDYGTAEATGEGWLVRFDRQLTHPASEVWNFLNETEGTELAAPATGTIPPLRFTNGYVPAGHVTEAVPGQVLEYEWLSNGQPAGRVRWEFSDGRGGGALTLTQTIPSEMKADRATALAAWHTHIELLAEHLRGQGGCWPEGRTEELRARYAETLPDT